MTFKNKKRIFLFSFITIALILMMPFLFHLTVRNRYNDAIFDLNSINKINKTRVAIVFGAGIDSNGNPSQVLSERVYAASLLYKTGKVEKILMSGDNRFENYNEPDAMIKQALDLGVKKEDMQADYAGRRTYDTCKRAKEIFGINNAILVTQDFHLPRAMYTCNAAGINVLGIESDVLELKREKYYRFRDIISLANAFIDIHIRKPSVVLGDKIDF